MNPMSIKNIAFYQFFKPHFDLEKAKTTLKTLMIELGIRGSVLLAQEGINASLAGPTEQMDQFIEFLLQTTGIKNPTLKVTYSQTVPFKRSLVKVKPFIVHHPGPTPLDLHKDSVPYLSPEELNRWIEEGKDMVLLDTRNDYEYEAGKFKDSLHLGTKHFADFENDLERAPIQWKDIPVITFCTGGIRCEKAAPLMVKKGFREVYQLEGGILNYFNKVGQGYYEGTCFVFDQRVAVDKDLKPQNTSYKSLGESHKNR